MNDICSKLARRHRKLSQLKTAFLTNISHEIRTPLTSILGFARVLREIVSSEQQRFVDQITESGDRLLETLNSVLELAQLESGSRTLTGSQINVAECVNEVADRYYARASRKGLTVEIEHENEEEGASVDRQGLTSALEHVLHNAVKFTDHGTVRISVTGSEDEIQIDIADTGCGIQPEVKNRICEPFRQGSTGITRSHDGTGLGLAITQKLLDLMGGTLTIESVPNEGTTVTLHFPRETNDEHIDAPPNRNHGSTQLPAPPVPSRSQTVRHQSP